MQNKIAFIGRWLGQHQKFIRRLQWGVILTYAFLIIVPTFLPLPDESATLLHNLTVFSSFLFWGIWWPFVILSIVLFGRLWCGVLCPEGSLSEFANKYGRRKKIPKWMRWGGWPFVAFSLTTLYGQMTSVYQYPKPVLLILGGSTLAAIVVGFLYGKSSRVWCKYLCPVTGVFAVLAKLAPWRYKPEHPSTWTKEEINRVQHIRCPTLLPLPKMTSASGCLMCGKCGLSNNAIPLTFRSPNQEIALPIHKSPSIFESILIIYGLCGLALGAFQWTNSFWFQHYRDIIDTWFLAHNQMWVFNTNAPWWIFTNYPERGDVFSWIYGMEVVGYIVAIGLLIGSISSIFLCLSLKAIGHFSWKRFKHLAQSFIPLGGCSVFIGLLSNTTGILQKYANIGFLWLPYFKSVLLVLATIWSLYLSLKIIRHYTHSVLRKIIGLFILLVPFLVINYSWVLTLYIWTIKADSIPWSTMWVWHV